MNHTDVTVLGFTLPEMEMEPILRWDPAMPAQTHAFAWAVVCALQNAGLTVGLLSSEPVSNFPQMPRLFYAGHDFKAGNVEGRTLTFVNLLAIKHVTRFISCLISGTRLLRSIQPGVLLIHGVHSPFLWYGVIARRLGLRTAVIITDPPGVFLPADGMVTRLLKAVDARLVRAALARVDGVVVLTRQLALDYAEGRPFLVMEGIYSEPIDESAVHAAPSADLSIVYAGGLSSSSGVDRLVLAVEALANSSVKLTIYGRGELAGWIDRRSKLDGRIEPVKYMSRKDVMRACRAADLLVQPRPVDQLVGAYSFPSKLLEYIGSGTPVLSTRLKGIPADYEPYLYWTEDDTVDGICNGILGVLADPTEHRRQKALRASDFVRSSRTSAVQGIRLRDFLRSL